MKNYLYIYLILIITLLNSCNNGDGCLNNRLNKIKASIDKNALNKFTNKQNEQEALTYVYLNRNLAFKNEIKNIYEDKKLINFFKKKRINNSEDIISIIFTSLYRKQNFKNINLETQIIKFYNIRNSLTKCEIWQNQNLIKNSNLNLNDSVKIRLKIYNKNCNRAVDCSNMDFNWKKIGERDLLIMGIISKKYYYKSVPNINYMRIKILKFSKKNVMIFGNFYKVGEQIEIVLNYDIIEKIHGSSPLLEVFPNNG